jgi:DHA3 family macrolide efflux protein-like MFS transporter
MDQSPTRGGRFLALLKSRPFRRLWVSQLCTVTVVYGLNTAGAVLVHEWTQSELQIGLVIVSAIMPAFLGSIVAGAVIDRFGRVRVLRISHLARVAVALLFWAGTQLLPKGPGLIVIYIVNVLAALLGQFATPAELALLPDLAHQTSLLSANTLYQFTMLIGEGLGVVLLGPLVVKLFGAPTMGLISAVLYLLAFVLVLGIPRDEPAAASDESKRFGWVTFRSDLQGGWRTIAKDRLLRLVTLQATLAAVLLLVLLTMLPGIVSSRFGLGVEDAPYLILPGGLGFALGTLVLNRWERRLNREGWIAGGLAAVGLNLGLLVAWAGVSGEYMGLFLALVTGVGFALAFVVIPARTVLQERPPAEMRGRVIAAQLALSHVGGVIPIVMGGMAADQLGIRPVMGVLCILASGAGAAGLFQARS